MARGELCLLMCYKQQVVHGYKDITQVIIFPNKAPWALCYRWRQGDGKVEQHFTKIQALDERKKKSLSNKIIFQIWKMWKYSMNWKKSMLQRKSASLDFDALGNTFVDEHTPTEWHRPNNSDTSLARGPINYLNKKEYYNHPLVFPEIFTPGP